MHGGGADTGLEGTAWRAPETARLQRRRPRSGGRSGAGAEWVLGPAGHKRASRRPQGTAGADGLKTCQVTGWRKGKGVKGGGPEGPASRAKRARGLQRGLPKNGAGAKRAEVPRRGLANDGAFISWEEEITVEAETTRPKLRRDKRWNCWEEQRQALKHTVHEHLFVQHESK